MRTLPLLTALLLLALQTQAGRLQPRGEEIPVQEQLGEANRDVVISFEGDERTALQNPDVLSGLSCYCRLGGCNGQERLYGFCRYRGIIFRLCCS